MAIPLRTAVFWSVYRRLEYMPPMQQPPDRVRRASDLRNRTLALPPSRLIAGKADPGAVISDTVATLPDGTAIPLRIYRPRDAGPGPLPVVMNFHGGGWVSGNVRQSEWWASSVAARAGVAVVSVEYRLAPEFPFPVPVEDCYAATEWVVDHADDLGLDGTRLAVMGDSAGGNIAAVVCLMARDRGGPAISLQVLIYPATDFLGDFPSKHENAVTPILCREDIENAHALYFHNSTGDRSDPYASPLRADQHDLPPALIQTAEHDPIRDEGRAYADALGKAGVSCRYTNYVDAVHGYISLPRLVPAARQALAETVGAIRDTLGR
jgi:acetyl esterase